MSNPINESGLLNAETKVAATDFLAGARNEVFGAMHGNWQPGQDTGSAYKLMADNTTPPVRIFPAVPVNNEDAWKDGPMGHTGYENFPDPYEVNHDDGFEAPFRPFR